VLQVEYTCVTGRLYMCYR